VPYRVDDRARKDPRFAILGKRLGTTRFDALGRMGEVWAYCAEHKAYVVPAHIIDVVAEFDGFAELICSPEVDLAEPSEGGVRIRGTKGRIEWLEKLRKNAKKGGRARASQKASHLASQKVTQTPAKADPGSSVLIPILSPVLEKKNTKSIPSGSAQKSCAENPGGSDGLVRAGLPKKRKSAWDDATRAKMRSFYAAYAEAYRQRYGGTPEGARDPQILGKIGSWIQHVSEDRACQLVRAYLGIESHRGITDSQHGLWEFFRHLNRIGNALQAGADPGGIDWAKVFSGGAS
jgi:hypothetical protein